MAVDVETEILIARPREAVAAYASDPANAPFWYRNIRSIEWESGPPLAVGSRMAFVAHFLGRRMAYTYEVVEWVAGDRLVMSTTDGPFPMETTYTWADAGEGATRMSIRNRGEPGGFFRLAAPLMSRAVRNATQGDLRVLKAMLEDRS